MQNKKSKKKIVPEEDRALYSMDFKERSKKEEK